MHLNNFENCKQTDDTVTKIQTIFFWTSNWEKSKRSKVTSKLKFLTLINVQYQYFQSMKMTKYQSLDYFEALISTKIEILTSLKLFKIPILSKFEEPQIWFLLISLLQNYPNFNFGQIWATKNWTLVKMLFLWVHWLF